MNTIIRLLNKQIDVKITGENLFQGILMDLGKDILVLFDGKRFLYIPLLHVHKMHLSSVTNKEISNPKEFSLAEEAESISYRTILTNAKGLFTEIYVTGKQPLYGYITSVLSDYFVFYSPIYKTMLIPLEHLKWLTLPNQTGTPYTVNKTLMIHSPNIPLLQSWEEQLKQLEGNLVVFDIGKDQDKIGLLNKVEDGLIEIITANGEAMFLKLVHIKSVHVP